MSTSAGNRKARVSRTTRRSKRRAEFELLDRPQRLWEYAIQQLPVAYLWGFDRLATRLRHGLQSSADHGAQASRSRSLDEGFTRQTSHMYAANLAFITALGHRYGFDALFYWHPDLSSKRCRSPGERIAAAQSRLVPEKAFSDFYRRVRQSAILNGHLGFRDISGLFDDLEAPYYVDRIHLSEPGNRLVAAAMLEDLIRANASTVANIRGFGEGTFQRA